MSDCQWHVPLKCSVSRLCTHLYWVNLRRDDCGRGGPPCRGAKSEDNRLRCWERRRSIPRHPIVLCRDARWMQDAGLPRNEIRNHASILRELDFVPPVAIRCCRGLRQCIAVHRHGNSRGCKIWFETAPFSCPSLSSRPQSGVETLVGVSLVGPILLCRWIWCPYSNVSIFIDSHVSERVSACTKV